MHAPAHGKGTASIGHQMVREPCDHISITWREILSIWARRVVCTKPWQQGAAALSLAAASSRHFPHKASVLQCLMDQLLTSEDDEGAAMPEQALRDELLTLLVAGQETSAVLLAWTLAYLAHNPGWQQACAAEVRGQLQGNAPTAENIGCAWLWPTFRLAVGLVHWLRC